MNHALTQRPGNRPHLRQCIRMVEGRSGTRRWGGALLALIVVGLMVGLSRPAMAAEWQLPPVTMPGTIHHPCIAATPPELARLRAAWAQTGPAHDAVARVVRQADRAMAGPLQFPPRGGQHNQWYQCEPCQLGLKTIDDTHHECPGCRKVYSGEPYDDVIFSRRHDANLNGAHAAAWAYGVTGNKSYADHAAAVLVGYAERYSSYPYHAANGKAGDDALPSGGHLFEQTLNEAYALATRIGPACDLIFDALTAQQRDAIRQGLLLPMLKSIDRNRAGKSNWQTWHNAAMVWAAPLVNDPAWLRKALADPKNGFVFQMGESVSAEGMWYENSWAYHFYTLRAMTATAEGCRRLGVDIWSHPTMRRMYTLPVRYTMSNGSLPRFGDDVDSTARVPEVMELAYAVYADQGIAALLPAEPTWDSILLGRPTGKSPPLEPAVSEIFGDAGHAILRSQGEAKLSTAMTFGPYGGFHGHLDKLSFVFYGHGKELGVDPGRAASQAYRLPIHTRWYKATLSHNTVLVDGIAQRPATGKLEFFATTPTHSAVLARCDAAYPGVSHRRLLCLAPDYLLVFDMLTANEPRRFDWVYHHRAKSVRCADARLDGKLPADYVGTEFLKNIRQGSTDAPIRIEFTSDDLATRLNLDASPSTRIFTADGPGASVLDRIPIVMITRRASSAHFAAVLEPGLAGRPAAVAGVSVTRDGDSINIIVDNAGTQELIHLTPEAGMTWTRKGTALLRHPTGAGH